MMYTLLVLGLLGFLGISTSIFKIMWTRGVVRFLWVMALVVFFLWAIIPTLIAGEKIRHEVNGCDFLYDYEQKQNDYCKTPISDYFLINTK